MNFGKAERNDQNLGVGSKSMLIKMLGSFFVGLTVFAYSVLEASGFEDTTRFLVENTTFNGRLHPQYDSLSSELKGAQVADPVDANRDHFRRVLLGVKFDFSDKARFNYLTDLSDRVVKNQIVRLELRTSNRSKWHLGYQKAPFGHEDTTSSSRVKPIERSANTRFWNDVLGLGTYHFGAYQYQDFGNGLETVFGLTHNVMGDSKIPDVFGGDFSTYVRISKKGTMYEGIKYKYGIDLAHQAADEHGAMKGLSIFSRLSFSDYEINLEGTLGDIDLENGKTAKAYGWHAQISRMVTEKLEILGRVSRLDTGGYEAKLSSLIRKAPYSGFKYQKVDSLYFGVNYLLDGNDLKLSAGYELGEGRDALSGVGPLDLVSESISGFRVRGQLNF